MTSILKIRTTKCIYNTVTIGNDHNGQGVLSHSKSFQPRFHPTISPLLSFDLTIAYTTVPLAALTIGIKGQILTPMTCWSIILCYYIYISI